MAEPFETGFNFNFNWDWSGLETFFADPHNWDREMAALNAGLNASGLLALPESEQIEFFKDFAAGDPEAIAQDKKWVDEIKKAQDDARATYNEINNIKTEKPVVPVGAPYYRGQCASRELVQNYSDGTSKASPAPDTTSPGCREDSGISLGTQTYTPPPAPSPTPPAPVVVVPPPPPPPPKTAPIDTVLFDEERVPVSVMESLILENIGGHELINIARNDTINGQTVIYQPIKNLSTIQQQYNPNNILALQNTSDKYFSNFSIKLETKLPNEGDGGGPDGAYVYIEQDTGDLIIELINLEPDEQIEVQISLSGTIYEAEFNES